MKYIIPLFIPALALIWLVDRDWQHEKDNTLEHNLRIQIEISDSLQALVDVCDARVNDMRLQRNHAIETNRWHKERWENYWGEMQRVKP